MYVLIFVFVIFAWAACLGRFMGGTGTWLPTGGRESAPVVVTLDPAECNCLAGPGELHVSDCPLASDANVNAVFVALVDDPDAGLSSERYWAELSC
jgi:hypothetical protein